MRKLAVIAATLLATTLPASAQTLVNTTGPWSVLDFGDSCVALNRPTAEFDAAPYNALGFHQLKTDGLPRMQAFFWPGVFKEGDPVQIFVTPAGGQPIELPSVAGSAFHTVSIDPAPEDLLQAMTQVPNVVINATGVTESLMFEMTSLSDVADLMGQCVNAAQ